MVRTEEDWLAIVVRARATVAEIERGEPVPLMGAANMIAGLWRAANEATDDKLLGQTPSLDARVRTFIGEACRSASSSDRRWHLVCEDEKMALFLAALYLTNTHPQDEITTAVRSCLFRGEQDDASVLEPRQNALWSVPRLVVTALGAVAAMYAGERYGYKAMAAVAIATGIASITLP
jgi:hypothetical protein